MAMKKLTICKGCSIVEAIKSYGRLMTVEELEEPLPLSKKTLYALAKRKGGIPAIRIGNLVRFEPRSVAEWLRSRAA